MTFEASAAYSITAPTVQVLVNGVVISSGMITAQTGVGTTLLSFGLDFPSGGLYPASLSFRFSDGSGEARTVTVTNITVNGQSVDTTYISMLSLTQGQSAALTVAPIDHLFGRVEPTLVDFPVPDVVGTASDDRLSSGATRAVISAAAGNDTVIAGAGDNIVSGGTGNDTIIGGAGNELLSGDADSDYIVGGAGNDLIYGGAGTDVLIGGIGDDIINGGTENDTLLGDAGNDVLYGEAGNDKLLGHAGNDYMYGDAGTDWLDGGANDDTMYGGDDNDLMSGSGGNDTLYGDNGDDDIDGGAGNDTITGGAGVDRASGGSGNDTINGGDGNALLLGDAGTDTLNGDTDNDSLLGGAGIDTLNGGAGNDTLYGHSLSLSESSVAVNTIANLTFNLSTNSFYRHITGAVTYAAAKAAAEAATIVVGGTTYYGHLVTITSAVENDFVDSLIGANATWMGASDSASEGAWRWQGGTESGLLFSQAAVGQNNFYTNWAAGEPNNTGNSDAAVLDVDGDWYDRAATDTVGYVIEWDGITMGDDNAADILNGDAGTDVLLGGGGNDTLSGGADADQVFGGLGDDTLNGNDGNDYLQDHAGTNSFNGGIGNDVLDSRFLGTGTAPAVGVQTMYGGDGNDFLYGNTGNDLLYGEANDDIINGYEGGDTIDGGTGVDTIYGGTGSDTLNGGDGNDTIYAVMPSVTLLSVNFNASEDGFVYADNTFGGTGGAYVAGSRNTTDGVNGNGSLQVLFDGTNATASGTMSGAYSETFNVTNDTENTILTFQYRVIREGTYETTEDTYVYIEFDGVRYGLNGNSHILKLESDGNDPQFDTGWRQVEIDLGTITAGSHTLSLGGLVEGKDAANEDSTIRFDNVTIASEVDDDDTFSNVIDGGNNDDIIYGSAGTDTLNGGAGNDTIYSASTTTNTIAGVLAAYSGVVHNATTGSFYLYVNSTLTWQAAQNAAVAYQIFGVAGHLAHSNSLTENQYLDTLSGTNNIWLGGTDGEENGVWRWIGGPTDGLQFWAGASGGVGVGQYANWNPGEPNDYNGWESRLEMYNGGLWNDQLEGSTSRYIIEWEDSQILVNGNTTTINGGAGNDTLQGGTGTDIINGGADNDTINGNAGTDTLNGDAGNDTINGGDGIDTISGGADNDTINGDAGNDILDGDAGDDTIRGGADNDTLYGGGGTDLLYGDAGNDTINSESVDTLASQITAILSANPALTYNATTGSFYQFVNTAVTWNNAKTGAAGVSVNGVAGHLVHITNAAENSAIDTLAGTNTVWLGGSDEGAEDAWLWIGGPMAGIQFWSGGSGGSIQNGFYENFPAGMPDKTNNDDDGLVQVNGGNWNDNRTNGATTNRYVIEWEGSSLLTPTSAVTLSGGAGTDTLNGGAGRDTFLFETTTVGSVDTITGYDKTDLDRIDISDLLTGYTGASDDDLFARFVVSGADLRLEIDANGATGGTAYTHTATLTGMATAGLNIEEMVATGLLLMA